MALGRLGLLLGMLLILLDPLTAIAYGAIVVLLFKLFFLVLVLLALWSRLSRQVDREPRAPQVVPPTMDAGSSKWYLIALGLAMGFAVVVLAVMVAQWS